MNDVRCARSAALRGRAGVERPMSTRPLPRAAGRRADARNAACSPSSAATAWARPRCRKAIMGLRQPRGGSDHASRPGTAGPRLQPTSSRPASAMCRKGAGSGRSLTVDEHLRLAARSGRKGSWTVERIYETFPRLAERKRNGGGQLSGGEQQMLAIGARAARQSLAPRHGRADRRPRARHRAAGRATCCAASPRRARSRCS